MNLPESILRVKDIGVCRCGGVICKREEINGGYTIYCKDCGNRYKLFKKIAVICALCKVCYKGRHKNLGVHWRDLIKRDSSASIKISGFCPECMNNLNKKEE